MGQASPDPTRRRRRRIVGWTVAGLLVILVGVGVWVTSRVLVVRDELAGVAQLQQRAERALEDGDVATLGDVVSEFDRRVDAAQAAASDPFWRAAETVPGLGQNLHAARVVTTQLHRIALDVADPVLALTEQLTAGELLSDGAIDVALVSSAAAPLDEARTTLRDVQSVVDGIPRDGLLGEVASGVDDVSSMLSSVGSAVSGLADLSDVLPGMLGSDEPRRILVMLQNNAELRSGVESRGRSPNSSPTGGRSSSRGRPTPASSAAPRRRSCRFRRPRPPSTATSSGDTCRTPPRHPISTCPPDWHPRGGKG